MAHLFKLTIVWLLEVRTAFGPILTYLGSKRLKPLLLMSRGSLSARVAVEAVSFLSANVSTGGSLAKTLLAVGALLWEIVGVPNSPSLLLPALDTLQAGESQ